MHVCMVFVLFSREFYAKGWPEPFIYGIFSRDFVRYTIIYGVYIGFWPTLHTHIWSYTHR